ncbi:uncharacterized protein LY79DRAFT_529292, partial [Colletotrichum navitas]
YICALHHQIQASIVSFDVRTSYEFVGAENPCSSLPDGTAEGSLLLAWTKYTRKWMQSFRDISASGLGSFLTVLDFLTARPDVRAHRNYMFLRPLMQPSDRVATLKTLCGRDWELASQEAETVGRKGGI